MDITLKQRIANNFENEVNNFMIYTRYKFAINNTDMKTPKGVLFVSTGSTFQ